MKNILIITDNEYLLNRFIEMIKEKGLNSSLEFKFNYAFSFNNKNFTKKFENTNWIKPIKIKEEVNNLIKEYNIIFSLHCKQIFPPLLVNNVKCINIHPGLNPYNRGWFPQVFSIINSLPCGATIHEIDEYLDHGPVICQKEVKIEIFDTSLSVYNKVLEVEIELLSDNILNIINFNYKTTKKEEGNLNLKKDFDKICEIDLNNKDTFKNHIDKLRALTHGEYTNAYFIDDYGNKIYLKLELKKQN